MPRIFSALVRASIDSACLPDLCRASPSARSFFTSVICASEIFAAGRAASMAFMCFGQLEANATPLVSAKIVAIARVRSFISLSKYGVEGRSVPGRRHCSRISARVGCAGAPRRVESLKGQRLRRHAGAARLTGMPHPLFPITREGLATGLARPAPPPDPRDLHVIALQEGTRVKDAAELVPIVHRQEGIRVLFTQRTPHLDDHAGQISFPGGRVEAEDAGREETALRETEEEIGLERGRVTLLGRLPDYAIPSGFRITPVVGWVEPPFTLKPDPF